MSASLAGLDASRAVDPSAYAIGDRAPQVALRPASSAEVAAALEAAHRDNLALVPWGGGSRLDRSISLPRYDVALDLTALDRVVEYDPEDLTLTVECGMRVSALAERVSARGQELPLESAHAERATVGGVLATNDSGPRRLRLGAPRDRILGVRFALADGTVARSGGKVVKNVAGLAVHRLLCGSRGGLAVLLEASLKLLPAPEERTALIYPATPEQISDAGRWEFLPRLETAFVTVLGANPNGNGPAASDTDFAVIIGLEDDAAWVAEQERRIGAALGAPVATLRDDDYAHLLKSLVDAGHAGAPRVTFTSANKTPAALAPLLRHREAKRLVFHAAAGRLHWFPVDSDAGDLAREMFGTGFTPIEVAGGARFAPAIPTEAGVLELRRRVRESLDPDRTLALEF